MLTDIDAQTLNQYLQTCIVLSKVAGKQILKVYYATQQVEYSKKEDDSPLTQADLLSHQTIIKGLSELTPNIPILSEESTKIDWEIRQSWQTYWLIDPLDGTKEFIKKNGEFTVNIALIHQHKVILGVVFAPDLKRLYYASHGNGAFMINETQPAQALHTKNTLSKPINIVGSRSHLSERMATFLKAQAAHKMVVMGSSLKLCLVAEGRADIYPRLGLTSEWDTAASQCVVEEAGGKVTKIDGSDLEYNHKDSLLNPEFFVFSKTVGLTIFNLSTILK